MSENHGQVDLFDINDKSIEIIADIENISESPEEPITEPFDPAKIDIKMNPMTLDLLIKRIKEKEINMSTEFQRQGGLWDSVKQSRLIESTLIRIPLPAFYFDGTDDNEWLIIDGLQRLTALENFIIKENLVLKNLEYLVQYNGEKFSDLPRAMQRRIEETQVAVFIVNPGTPPDVKFNIFKRINTGGLTLEPQEIRHALNQGIPADFLKELAELPEFKQAIGGVIKSERMEDREFVLRFLAFNLTHYNQYTPDLDNFLNHNMGQLKYISPQAREDLKLKFINAMTFAFKIFDKNAFRKLYNRDERRRPINKALFETWSVNLGHQNIKQLEILLERKELVIDKFIQLMADATFERSVTAGTGDRNTVKIRFERIEELIKEVLR